MELNIGDKLYRAQLEWENDPPIWEYTVVDGHLSLLVRCETCGVMHEGEKCKLFLGCAPDGNIVFEQGQNIHGAMVKDHQHGIYRVSRAEAVMDYCSAMQSRAEHYDEEAKEAMERANDYRDRAKALAEQEGM